LLWQHCFPALTELCLELNNLGPRGARALAPGLAAAASRLEVLSLLGCTIGNEGATNLVPDGQVNRSVTRLILQCDLWPSNEHVDGDNVVALAAR
jgi:Leucine Rich repeat